MKKLILYITIVLSLVLVSCAKQEDNTGVGMLNVDVELPTATKALTEEQLVATAKVNIYKADFSGLVRSYNYNQIPSPFYLAADSYRVDVIAGEVMSENPALASWENKSYKGSESFTIVANQVTTVAVTAEVNNAVTKISFDPSIANNFNEGYTLAVSLNGVEQPVQLVYDASKSEAEGYFIVDGLFEPSLTWTFNGTLTKDSSPFTKTGTIPNVEPGKLYKMNVKYTIKDGDLTFTLTVDRAVVDKDDTITFIPVSTGLAASSKYEIWAKRATVYADVDPEENAGKKVEFSFSSDGTTWTNVDGVANGDNGEGAWKAVLTGLTPSTEYTYKLLVAGEEIGESLTFTTEAAPNLPNASFEHVSLVTGATDPVYYKFYDPNCTDPDCVNEGGHTMFWGSGNGEGQDGVNGSAKVGTVITKIDTDIKVDGNQSILAVTGDNSGFLAAGNLFTGQFDGLVGMEGGKVKFGRPWTSKSRPSALKLYCKYSTGKINFMNNDNLGLTKNQDYDRAQIKVAIGTWDYSTYGGDKNSPILVNTTNESTFVDFYSDNSTIANGDLIIYRDGYLVNQGNPEYNGTRVTLEGDTPTDTWIEYTIPLHYHDLNKYPTHIIVSCASSQYGDYFTGYSGAKLWLDKFELIYE